MTYTFFTAYKFTLCDLTLSNCRQKETKRIKFKKETLVLAQSACRDFLVLFKFCGNDNSSFFIIHDNSNITSNNKLR